MLSLDLSLSMSLIKSFNASNVSIFQFQRQPPQLQPVRQKKSFLRQSIVLYKKKDKNNDDTESTKQYS